MLKTPERQSEDERIVLTSTGPTNLVSGEVLADDPFLALDRYADAGYMAPAYPDSLATISAGYKGEDGRPVVSRDGTIYLRDPDNRAPNLRLALAEADHARKDAKGKIATPMKLKIALPYPDLASNLHQRFARYSAGRLEAHGDASGITEMVVKEWRPTKNGGQEPKSVERVFFEPGSPGWDAIRRTCPVSWSLYFLLAEWVPDKQAAGGWKPRYLMPDGFGLYRLTSTSRLGLQAVLDQLKRVYRARGSLAGVVLDLTLTYPPVVDPLGVRRTQVPRWVVLFNPPAGIVLDQDSWHVLSQVAQTESAKLALPPAPRRETWEAVDYDMSEAAEPDDRELAAMVTGDGPATQQAEFWRREFFGQVRDTSLSTDAGRAAFLAERTGYEHLTEVLAAYSNSQMQELVAQAAEVAGIERERKAAKQLAQDRPAGDGRTDARRYDELMRAQGLADDAPAAARVFEGECIACGHITLCQEWPAGVQCADQDGCRVRQAPTVEAPRVEARGTVVPPEAIVEDDESSGRPLDSPVDNSEDEADVQATLDMEPEDDAIPLLLRLERGLKAAGMGGDVFVCAECKTEVGSVKVRDRVLPAREWLAELAMQNIDKPLCLMDAQLVLRDRAKAAKAKATAKAG